MSLHLVYRPGTFDEMVGNVETVSMLKILLKRKEDMPHTLLFSGPSGCGKTTLARIMASELGASGRDLKEVNGANHRSIDSVRTILGQMQLKPWEGSYRVWILDECFAEGTPIKTPIGDIPIGQVKKGDPIYSIEGSTKVKNVFKNKVALDRVIKLKLSNGKEIITTKQHLFLTDSGWKEAQYLEFKDLVFPFKRKFRTYEKEQPFLESNNYRKGEGDKTSRWRGTQYERSYIKRQKENRQIKPIRVESVEVYESRNRKCSFQSVIGDRERNQGFVIFYDLEIEGHPSYFANDIPVHNCHRLTPDAQSALLKALEDTPPHVFFMLCTTDPQRLLPTILSRCATFKVEKLHGREMTTFIQEIADAESKEISSDVKDKIVSLSDGCPRMALVALDKVIDLPQEEMLDAVGGMLETNAEIIDLCRAVIKKEGWTSISKILRGLSNEDPENVRRAVLRYCNTVLLSKDNPRAYLIMSAFSSPFYDTGISGLTIACYEALNG